MSSIHTTLIVDDEPQVVESLQNLLRHEYHVLGATSGDAALEILQQQPVQVVLADHRMPDMSGIELLRRVHDAYPDTLRLLMTGYADPRTLVDAINIGSVYRYIPKPCDPEELQNVLRSACQVYDLQTAHQRAAQRSPDGRARHELRRLRTVLASRRALSNVLHVVARHVRKLCVAKACAIYLLRTDKTCCRLTAMAHDTADSGEQAAAYLSDAMVLRQVLATDDLSKCAASARRSGARILPPANSEDDLTVCVPLTFHGSREGVMLVRLAPHQEISPALLVLLETIAAETAAAVIDGHLREEVVQAEHLKRGLALAADVQRNMIPHKPVQVPNFDLAALYRPQDGLAGDFFDFIELPQGNMGIAVCDVIDRGVRASLLMAAIRASLRAHASSVYDMREVLSRVNRDLCAETGEGDFATLFYGVLDCTSRFLTFSNAGHCPALLFHEDRVVQLGSLGPVLGIDPTASFALDRALLHPGDVVGIYTDGLVEATNPAGELFGYGHLSQAFATAARQGGSAAGIAHEMFGEVERFTQRQPQCDDRTLVVVRAL